MARQGCGAPAWRHAAIVHSMSSTPRQRLCIFGIAFFVILLAPGHSNPRATGGASVAGRVLDADTGEIIPCSVSIQTSQGEGKGTIRKNVSASPSNGRFEFAVPPGDVTLRVSRGFDYVTEQRQLQVHPGQQLELTFHLHRQANLRSRGWYCGDNHVHMIHGAGKSTVTFPYVALAARAAGLDYMSIAQNWNLPREQATPAYMETICRRVSTPDLILVWNMEAPKNYWRGDVTNCLGHCWMLGMHGATAKGQDAIQELSQLSALDYESQKTPTPNFESMALIHALGGVVAYTHPCRWDWGTWGGKGRYPLEEGKFISNLAQELPYDTVVGPTYDAIDILMQPWDRENYLKAQKLWFMLLNKGYRIAATASTDTSFGNPALATPGLVRTYTRVDGPPSISAIAQSMKSGRNFVTSGPLLLLKIGNHQAGDVIQLRQPVDFTVSLEAWASGMPNQNLATVELLRNGAVVRSFDAKNGDRKFATRFNINESGTAWYIARCFGADKLQVAITNPVYFVGRDYRPPQPGLARVAVRVTDMKTGKPLSGNCRIVRRVGQTPVQVSMIDFTGGRFTAEVPGTVRLRVEAKGYKPMEKSVFMDDGPLLQMTLNMREAELTDWRTFEEIRRLLQTVSLNFPLTPVQ